MYEKVNPAHPDKIADRIAGAIVDLAYKVKENPKVAAEVQIGHGRCFVVVESDVRYYTSDIEHILERLLPGEHYEVTLVSVDQDPHLAENQSGKIRCGDNGTFKGTPTTWEQWNLTNIAKKLYWKYKTDGKYIQDGDKLIICQSHSGSDEIKAEIPKAIVNPLGEWSGGPGVDTGAVNRKLGSDMGDAVTGAGLHGKDLSKADVSVNIYCHLKAFELGEPVEISVAIGDEYVDGKPYSEIVEIARNYIENLGGFEKFAEWGLIR